MLPVIGYALAVAALLSAVGFCVEQLLARWVLPRRAAWCLAMLVSMLFPLLMMSRAQSVPAAASVIQSVDVPVAAPSAVVESRAARVSVPAITPAHAPAISPAISPATIPEGVPAAAPAAESPVRWNLPPLSDRFIFALWIAASSLLLLYVCGANVLLHYRASRWRRESVMEHEVLISTDTGPALLGALRPRIVVPHWYLDEPDATRMLILQHEQQHIAGRDPLLLWAAVLVVVALPWNLPLWWQLRRLRLAIELDCDARVLRTGADAGSYGEVLLAVTRRAEGLRGVAIAMGQPVSSLERRIHNLVRVAPRHLGLRTAGSVLMAVAGAAAAAMIEAPVMPGAGPDIGSHANESASVLPMAEPAMGRGVVLPAVGAAPAMTNAAPEKPVANAPAAGATKPLPANRPAPANPLECIDPDVLHALLLQKTGAQALNVGNVSPPELADFKVPRELRWVAAAERSYGEFGQSASSNRTSVAAVYRSSLPPAAARTAAIGALTAGGWTLHDGAQTPNAFTALSSSMGGETYCRAGKPVSVSAGALDGITYLTLSITRNVGAGLTNACDQPLRSFSRPASVLDKYLPKLELPRDPATGQPVSMNGGGGGGGGGNSSKSNVAFTLKDSVANVASHFARQIAEQGWIADASWSGLGTAGSTWTRKPDADTNLRATLTATAFDDGRFTVIFSANIAK